MVTTNMSVCWRLRRVGVDSLDIYKFPLTRLKDWSLGGDVALSDLSTKEAGFYRRVTEFVPSLSWETEDYRDM